MIVYSVTVTLDLSIEADWLKWMQEKHIPDVMETGYFISSHLQRLVYPVPDAGTATFNVRYLCENIGKYEEYSKNAAPALQAEHTERYKDRFVAFRTILEGIKEF